jgi:alkyl hydroperoxide reductase subunit AhpC
VALDPNQTPQVGDLAPEFELPSLAGGVKGRLRLRDLLKDKGVMLAFYPGNWDEVSRKQMLEYQAQRDRFAERGVEVVGISVDSIMNTTVWERAIGPLDFPLCSDFWPHGTVSTAYGVLRHEGPQQGHSDRAVVIMNQSGVITFRKVYSEAELPTMAETWEALRAA